MTEMDKLDAALTAIGIEHTYNRDFQGGTQIVVCDGNKRLWDAVCTRFSYGGTSGLLEVYGEDIVGNDEDVIGWLTAEGVVEMVKENTPCT